MFLNVKVQIFFFFFFLKDFVVFASINEQIRQHGKQYEQKIL